MPSKKKKYNARFPAGRIKKIMQSDEEIGKVAQAVPVIISRTLELFVESLLTKTLKITNTRNAKTLSPTHLKQCIMAEQRFDFLRELVKNIPDISLAEEAAANYMEMDDVESSPEQDTFSDVASDASQQPSTTTTTAVAVTLNNGASLKQNGGALDLKLRRTRSMQHQQDIIEHLQHRVVASKCAKTLSPSSSPSTSNTITNNNNNSTVIVHTNTFVPKLLRTESNPAIQTCTPAKRGRQTATTTATSTGVGITSPIVSYDFCSKPVVKIDYSNIQLTAGNVNNNNNNKHMNVPQSAPAQIAVPQTSIFDFSKMGHNPSPISINIDLSSIKLNKSSHLDSASNNINSNTNNNNNILLSSKSANCTMPNVGENPNENAIKPNTIIAKKVTTAKDALLELDEDYDNI